MEDLSTGGRGNRGSWCCSYCLRVAGKKSTLGVKIGRGLTRGLVMWVGLNLGGAFI